MKVIGKKSEPFIHSELDPQRKEKKMPNLKFRKSFAAILVLTFLVMPLSVASAARLVFDPDSCTAPITETW